eukprot:CAMPEP_0118887216 /NCGR_PEP_ID=MMETSP1163-20130328/25015_1 /TAXON_ID=124430 /ORGANISM="Phaeomonas parva, Strain CCMP2877" /LENGTH=694 /DNA_ID=CAMNT_0006825613 /DNA_START=159 /DNA_END=2243 /DNA_ORIENTATION=+
MSGLDPEMPMNPPKVITGRDVTGDEVEYPLAAVENNRVALYSRPGAYPRAQAPKIGPANLFAAMIIVDDRADGPQSRVTVKPWMVVERQGRTNDSCVVCGIKKATNGGHSYIICYALNARKFYTVRWNLARIVSEFADYGNVQISEAYEEWIRTVNSDWAEKKQQEAAAAAEKAAEKAAAGASKDTKADDDGSRGRKWTEEEDRIMISSVQEFHNYNRKIDWAEVSKLLPGRSTTQVTCHWHNTVKPKLNPGKYAPRNRGQRRSSDGNGSDTVATSPTPEDHVRKKIKVDESDVNSRKGEEGSGGGGNDDGSDYVRSGAGSPNPEAMDKGGSSGNVATPQSSGGDKTVKRQRKRKQQMSDSDRPYLCPYPGCGSGFTRRFDMGRHCERIHGMKLVEIRSKVLAGDFGPEAQDHARKDPFFETGPPPPAGGSSRSTGGGSSSSSRAKTAGGGGGSASAPQPKTAAQQSAQLLRTSLEKGGQRNMRTLASAILKSASLGPAAETTPPAGAAAAAIPAVKPEDGAKSDDGAAAAAATPEPLKAYPARLAEGPHKDTKLFGLSKGFSEISQLALEAIGRAADAEAEEQRLDAEKKKKKEAGDKTEGKDGAEAKADPARRMASLQQQALDLRSKLARVEQDLADARRSPAFAGARAAGAGPDWTTVQKQTMAPQNMVNAWRQTESVRRAQPSLGLLDFV